MPLGSLVMVPLTNPASVDGLMRLAADLARPDGGTVVPVTLLSPMASSVVREQAAALVRSAEEAARAAGVAAEGVATEHESVAAGVVELAAAHGATLVLMGWRGRSTHRNVFGDLIDTVVGRSRTPMAVVRLGSREAERVLLPISDEHLDSPGEGGVTLASGLVARLSAHDGRDVRVLRTGAAERELPEAVSALSDRVHHDPRRYHVAIGAAADVGDLVVVPVAPTVSGLRTATTHVAWQAPEATLLVAIDVGPPAGDVAEATRAAGQPAPAGEGPPSDPGEHTVVVIARFDEVAPASRERLGGALRPLGTVGEVDAWEDEEGRRCVRSRVRVAAQTSNAALSLVMTSLHESESLRGAELRYELETAGGDKG